MVSTLSNFSNLSLTSETSSQDISHLLPSTQSSLSTVKHVSLSLAERRGSLSKSLKLPVTTGNVRVNSTPTILTDQGDAVKISNNSYTLCKPDGIEIVFEGKDASRNRSEELTHLCQVKIPPGRVTCADSSFKEFTSVNNFAESWRNLTFGEGINSSIPSGLEKSVAANCNQMQPLVCRWPTFEKVLKFGSSDLNSKSAFAIFPPSTDLGKSAQNLYVWVGRSLCHDKGQIQLDNSRESRDLGDIDWSQFGYDILIQMGLPKDTPIKVWNLLLGYFISFLFVQHL